MAAAPTDNAPILVTICIELLHITVRVKIIQQHPVDREEAVRQSLERAYIRLMLARGLD
jgi:hypothetical protein